MCWTGSLKDALRAPGQTGLSGSFPPARMIQVIGLLLTLITAWRLHLWTLRDDEARTVSQAVMIKEAFDNVTEHYEWTLGRLQDFFAEHDNPSRGMWESRISLLKMEVDFPAVIEIGYAPMIHRGQPHDDRFQQAFTLANPQHPAPRLRDTDHRLPILFHLASDKKATTTPGLDLLAGDDAIPVQDATSRAELRTSRHVMSLASPATGTQRHGVRWFWPVYHSEGILARQGEIPGTAEVSRFNEWQGTVFATIDMDRIMQSVSDQFPAELAVNLHDGPDPARSNLLNPVSMAPAPGFRRPSPDHQLTFNWYGQKWSMEFRRTARFYEHSTRARPLIALALGTSATFLISTLISALSRSRQRAMADADALRHINDRLATALREREQLSRDIHDNTIQNLYAIGLNLQHCVRVSEEASPELASHLRRDADYLNAVILELRQVLATLQPDLLTGQSLGAILQSLGDRLAGATGCIIQVETDDALADSFPPSTTVQLVSFAREAISNSIRHGQAGHIEVCLEGSEGSWTFCVRDDGTGFDPAEARLTPGHGLANLRARAEAMEAGFRLESTPGSGTTVCLTCPPTHRI